MGSTFHTCGRLLHHTQYARSRWCFVHCTPLHCNNFEFTIHLMIVGLLSTGVLQYLKCQGQRISKNCRSTFIFCSSWNLWGVPIFTFSLPGGRAARTPAPRQLRYCLLPVTFHQISSSGHMWAFVREPSSHNFWFCSRHFAHLRLQKALLPSFTRSQLCDVEHLRQISRSKLRICSTLFCNNDCVCANRSIADKTNCANKGQRWCFVTPNPFNIKGRGTISEV